MKVSDKGAVSVYGMGRFPVTRASKEILFSAVCSALRYYTAKTRTGPRLLCYLLARSAELRREILKLR
jgi:hypothetical protein